MRQRRLRYEESIASFEAALRADADYVDALIGLGQTLNTAALTSGFTLLLRTGSHSNIQGARCSMPTDRRKPSHRFSVL